jgi:phosphatidylinositol alpha-1,6-mannosyltransferase
MVAPPARADAVTAPRVLVVTNDFPPRRGGIENYVWSLCAALDPDGVVVHASATRGSEALDASAPFRIVRDPTSTLLPTPAVARRVVDTLRAHRCEVVVFGASAPLGLLAPRLRRAGASGTIALTHGHEVWWARTPVARALLSRIGDANDVLTYVSRYSCDRIAAALSPDAANRMQAMPPGVDLAGFRPQLDGSSSRRAWGVDPDQPVVLSLSRLVPRKGHDVLLAAWPTVAARHPRAVLVIAGDGPMRTRLERQRRRLGLADSVRLVPGAPWAEMPERYAAADVFALPCRTRRWGLEPEALGIVFLEAAACGLPVVVGRSGGAHETAVDGDTGVVVDPRDPEAVADALSDLLADPAKARAMGARGRRHVSHGFSEQALGERFRALVAAVREPAHNGV